MIDYDSTVREYFEQLKPMFINVLRSNFALDYDTIMSIYVQVWMDVRENILNRRVEEDTRWKAYILKMGLNQACRIVSRKPPVDSLDDERFDYASFEREMERRRSENSVYEDPDMQALLTTEMSYIPEPCNKILKLFYYDGLSMSEIATAMNFANARSAITTKKRCFDRLRERFLRSVNLLGLIE